MLEGSIAEGKLAGSISNGKLANSTVSFGGVQLSLGGTDATPAFNLSDATGYPTTSLVGTITNDQLLGSIGDNKLLTIATADKVALSALNIDGGTDIGAALADADLIIVDDGAGGTNRKCTMERVKQHGYAGITGGDVTVASTGVATIGAGRVANSMLTNSSMTVTDGNNSTAIALGGTITFTGTEFSESSGTISLAADAVKFSNLKVLPGAQGAGGDSSTVAFNLQNRVASDWFDRVLVFRNGQLQQKVSSFSNNDSSEYTVTDNGSNTIVTFGAAPLAGESIFISYLYEG